MKLFFVALRRLAIAALVIYLAVLAAIVTAGAILQLQPHDLDCQAIGSSELYCAVVQP